MKVFLDSSTLIAASLSEEGASYWIARQSLRQGWRLITADYCVDEVENNLQRMTDAERLRWVQRIRPRVETVVTWLALDCPMVFDATKDKPVIISALAAEADFLVTLDRHDFERWLGSEIYGLRIVRPSFLMRMKMAT